MLHRSFKPAKCKTSLKLATSRMKLLRNKKDAQLKQLKREVSQLLESGKDRTARLRVEHVAREENTIAAYDLLEIYCELIVARLPIIESQKNCPLDLKEAIASVIFASPRCADIPEFVDVKKHFTAKYGKGFVTAATELRPDSGVSRMLIEKLSVKAPDGQTKLKILAAIAEEFNIKWDPESSGENELKPPEDLLNGPTTFANASEMHPHPAVQSLSSNVQAPSSRDEKPYAPVDVDHHMSSTYVKDDSFTSSPGGHTTTAVPSGLGFRPSGTGSRDEVRHAYSGGVKDSSIGRQNWHMEFEDATAAAQAAAESAERATMAARAAAEIASREKITSKQYSTESHISNVYSFRKEGSRDYAQSSLPTSDSAKIYDSSSRNSHIHTKQTHLNHPDNLGNVAHSSYRDGHDSTRRSDRSDSLRSRTASVVDNKRMNDFQDLETSLDDERIIESKKEFPSGKNMRQQSSGSSAEFVIGQRPDLQYERTDLFGEERIRKQPSNISSDSLPRDHVNDFDVPHSSFQKFGVDSFENPFVSVDQGITKQANSNNNAAVFFDDSGSDEDIISFDTQPDYDRKPSKIYSPSHGRESSSHSSINTATWSPQKDITGSPQESLSAFNYSAERNSPHKFDENVTSPSQPNDLFPATFDDSDNHSSASENELEKSRLRGKVDPRAIQHEEDLIQSRNRLSGSVLVEKCDTGSNREHGLHYSFSDDDEELVPKRAGNIKGTSDMEKSPKEFGSDEPLSRKSKFGFDSNSTSDNPTYRPLDEEKPLQSRRSSRSVPVIELKDEENRRPSSRDTMKDKTSFHQSNLEGKSSFGTLTGGLQNKSFRPVPYVRSSRTALSPSSENKTGNIDDSGVSSSFKPGGANPKVKDKGSSTTPVASIDSDIDDSEEELPHNSHAKQKPYNAKASKEVHARSRIKASAPDTFFGSDEGDSEKDIPRLSLSGLGRAGSGLSRRTKGVPSPRKVSYSTTTALESSVSADADPVKKVSRSRYESNTPPRQESGTVNLNWETSDRRALKQTTSEPMPDSNISTRKEYLKSSTMEQPPSPLKKVQLASYGSSKASVATQEGPSRESSSSKSMSPLKKVPSASYGSPKASVATQEGPSRESSSRKSSHAPSISPLKKVPSASAGSPKSSISHAEAPSRESSFGKASHVHPKLPDYDTIAAMLQSRRTN